MSELSIQHSSDCIQVFRAGQNTPIITQRAETDKRPYIHPIVAPDGKGILTEDTPGHHLWQHGLYIGLNDVNGVGFWTEGLSESNKATDGSFHPKPLAAPDVQGNTVTWMVETEYRTPDGAPMMTEHQQWKLEDELTHYQITFNWTLKARIDIRFGEYAYGGLFVRMPYRKDLGAMLLNSEGHTKTSEAESQRARWVAISMPIEGRTDWAGVAMMDHPTNPEHPVPWRTDGQYGISPSQCIAGEWTLAKGQSQTSCYGMYIFCGEISEQNIEKQWSLFTA